MNKVLRLSFGMLLPVPLYCTCVALLNVNDIVYSDLYEMANHAALWLGIGYMIMGVPSLIYSAVIEHIRAKKENLRACILTGSLLGFVFGSFLLFFDGNQTVFLTMSLPGAVIGAIIPIMLWPIKSSEPDVAGQRR